MEKFCKMTEEMVVSILSRLLPKSLMRFKCIHKSWHSLINSPQFISKHLHSHQNLFSSTTILLKRPVMRRTDTGIEEIVCSFLNLRNANDGGGYNLRYDIKDLEFPPSMGLKTRGQFIQIPIDRRYHDCAYIIGHCDGVFCLALYDAKHLVLYNPAIKEFKFLPESCLQDKNMGSVGFGYDPKSEDYILVNVVSYGEQYYKDDRLVIDPLRAEVYTMSTNCWREIKIHNLETETTFIWPRHFQVYFKGNCYWLAHEKRKEYITLYDRLEEYYIWEAIVCFDTADRIFRNILVPDCLYEFPMHDLDLTVWNDSTALFGFYRGGSRPFEIWVMTKFDGLNSSWIKQLSVDIARSPIPLTLWESNEILLVFIRKQIALYSFVNEKYQYLPVYGASFFQAIPYVNSIVPVKR
ncbi:PREDICTED: F-box/kelch-repeat protein At3g23880-like [Fragaria vesca subsp. vesca]|uniref:F-box/kelch-repeat protein At3g23880-like n=1 Tax=Fragaria vesca subsp. vesca TaxID=101020 RepID=UPI0002C31B4C|nr:PREDICTED: F-box/kelch-repeat protein At3g23880-like [Fragaria vesca subsp. vesca]